MSPRLSRIAGLHGKTTIDSLGTTTSALNCIAWWSSIHLTVDGQGAYHLLFLSQHGWIFQEARCWKALRSWHICTPPGIFNAAVWDTYKPSPSFYTYALLGNCKPPSYRLQATAIGRAALDASSRNGRPVRVCHLQACPRTVTETRHTSTQLTNDCFSPQMTWGCTPSRSLPTSLGPSHDLYSGRMACYDHRSCCSASSRWRAVLVNFLLAVPRLFQQTIRTVTTLLLLIQAPWQQIKETFSDFHGKCQLPSPLL